MSIGLEDLTVGAARPLPTQSIGPLRDSSVIAARNEHRGRACGVRTAQAGAQIVRVGDAVKRQQQISALRYPVRKIGFGGPRTRLHPGQHTLVAQAFRSALQSVPLHAFDMNPQ